MVFPSKPQKGFLTRPDVLGFESRGRPILKVRAIQRHSLGKQLVTPSHNAVNVKSRGKHRPITPVVARFNQKPVKINCNNDNTSTRLFYNIAFIAGQISIDLPRNKIIHAFNVRMIACACFRYFRQPHTGNSGLS